uniref:Kelch-like family member 32 n=1 Tax=Eptatretus burgeri TaxID=7764 RepID=A0A8C4NED3_EPTBU
FPTELTRMMSVTRSCWQSNTHTDRVLASLNLQRRSGCLCDVVLVAGDNPPQRFQAHRAVLAACSDYFRAMFSLSMMESGAQEVTLKGVGDTGLETILDFAYTGQVLSPYIVLAAASHLQFLEIQCFCSKFLAQVYLITMALNDLSKFCHQQALHVIGGKYRDSSKSNQVLYLSTESGSWKERTTLPKVCSHHCIAVLGMFLYVAGGQEKKWANRSVYRFDPRGDGCWLEVAPMLKCREHFALGALSGRLFAAGGRNELRQLLPTVEAYCPLTNKWALVAPLEHSLSCHAGCVAGSLFWVSGGVTNTAQYQDNMTAYDPTDNCWTQYSGMPHRRVYHTMASIPGRLYVLGGNSLDGNNDRVIVPYIDRYCIASDQWSRLRMCLPAGIVQ